MREKPKGKGDAFAELMFEVTTTFYRFRAAGQLVGFVNKRGGGTVGFMRSLAVHGPATVSDLARMRPTSRQRMQQLADELLDEGLIEFVANPAHRTAKLARLTPKGNAHYRTLLERMRGLGEMLSSDLTEAEMRAATEVMHRLRNRLVPD